MAMRPPPGVVGTSPTCPTASMRPVNISFDDDIRAQYVHAPVEQGTRGEGSGIERHPALSDRGRCNIQLDVVGEVRVPDRRMESRAALDHNALDLARVQRTKRRVETCLRGRHDCRAHTLE